MVFLVFLLLGVWQDIRSRTVSIRYLIFFGIIGLISGLRTGPEPAEVFMSVLPGAALLLAGKAADGQIGEGDGWFFVVSGLYLGPVKNWIFLLTGLTLCGIAGLFWIVRTGNGNKSERNRRIPFLPFLIPAGLWMTLL